MIALVGGVTSANSEVHAYSASAPRPVPKTSHGLRFSRQPTMVC